MLASNVQFLPQQLLKAHYKDGLLKKDDKNLNLEVSHEYSQQTRDTVAALDEAIINYDLMDQLLGYIKSLQMPGLVLEESKQMLVDIYFFRRNQ